MKRIVVIKTTEYILHEEKANKVFHPTEVYGTLEADEAKELGLYLVGETVEVKEE
jgi:hypothetical protein